MSIISHNPYNGFGLLIMEDNEVGKKIISNIVERDYKDELDGLIADGETEETAVTQLQDEYDILSEWAMAGAAQFFERSDAYGLMFCPFDIDAGNFGTMSEELDPSSAFAFLAMEVGPCYYAAPFSNFEELAAAIRKQLADLADGITDDDILEAFGMLYGSIECDC